MCPTIPFSSTTLLLAAALAGAASAGARADEPLRVSATLSDLGALARTIGGDDVEVTTFAPPAGDPHYIDARPGFVKALSRADLFIRNGLDLESGWAPVLWQQARNPAVMPGGAGHLDASRVIEPLEVPSGPVDRAQGDVHALGNPHYLLDPLNGLRVAALMRDALIALRPEKKEAFAARFDAFKAKLGAAWVGEALAKKYDVEKLARLDDAGRLDGFLEQQKQADLLGGWAKTARGFGGAKAVADHRLWSYFARRFRIEVVGHIEPLPGIPPTTRHLGDLVPRMKSEGVRVILRAPYFDVRSAEFLAERTGARIVTMVHQTGALEGTEDYVAAIDHNVRVLAEALGAR